VTEDRAAIVDEYGELSRRIQELKPTTARAEQLRKTIQGWYDNEPADQSFTAIGRKFSVQVSARANKRSIRDIFKLARVLGRQLFMSIATVRMEDLDRHLTEDQANKLIAVDQTGPRKIEPVLRDCVIKLPKAA